MNQIGGHLFNCDTLTTLVLSVYILYLIFLFCAGLNFRSESFTSKCFNLLTKYSLESVPLLHILVGFFDQ